MNAILYILLTPIRYSVSFVGFVVTALLLGVNWCVCGEYDNDKGLFGIICVVIPGWLLDHVNNPLIRLHNALKPIAWTFYGAVNVYRKTFRWWADKAASNHEYRKHAKNNVDKSITAKERKFWTIVRRRGHDLYEARTAEAIAEQAAWDASQKPAANDPNFLPNTAP